MKAATFKDLNALRSSLPSYKEGILRPQAEFPRMHTVMDGGREFAIAKTQVNGYDVCIRFLVARGGTHVPNAVFCNGKKIWSIRDEVVIEKNPVKTSLGKSGSGYYIKVMNKEGRTRRIISFCKLVPQKADNPGFSKQLRQADAELAGEIFPAERSLPPILQRKPIDVFRKNDGRRFGGIPILESEMSQVPLKGMAVVVVKDFDSEQNWSAPISAGYIYVNNGKPVFNPPAEEEISAERSKKDEIHTPTKWARKFLVEEIEMELECTDREGFKALREADYRGLIAVPIDGERYAIYYIHADGVDTKCETTPV